MYRFLLLLFFCLYNASLCFANDELSLVEWSKTAVLAVGQLDYQHYNNQVAHSKAYFTPAGWQQIEDALNKYNVNSLLLLQNGRASTGVYSTPQLMQDWRVPGVHFYKIKVLSEFHYHSSFATWDMPVVVILTIASTASNHYRINHVDMTYLH